MTSIKRSTRDNIIYAARKLFYSQGIRAVSVDAVAEKAGVTKRTLYYHFKSKDDLIEQYLVERDQPNIKLFQGWFDEISGRTSQKIENIFTNLAISARHKNWKGCGFSRTAAELANMPGHPAIGVSVAHKQKCEEWLTSVLSEHDIKNAPALARQIVLLIDGAFSITLINKDPSYIEEAGRAAAALVEFNS